MSNTKQVSFPILGILGLIFITLKLGGWGTVATWSWWLVLMPFWVPVVLVLIVALVVFTVACFVSK